MLTDRQQKTHQLFLNIQEQITGALAGVDGAKTFLTDDWQREGGGGGRTRVLAEGAVFEKGGVNVSCVHGEFPEQFAHEIPGPGRKFFATGVSLVIHPRSPQIPTVHANFRYLEKTDGQQTATWFGGGADLTPWILYEEDARHFHGVWKSVCDQHAVADYGRFKKWCDEYFFLPHRGETRGIGGIFFDYLGWDGPQGTPAEWNDAFAFVKAAASAFVSAYVPIVERRKTLSHTNAEREWQLYRRGRYVEFNLIYDRGTVFGLKTKGRTESILMSLPNLVKWGYNQQPETAAEKALLAVLRQPRDWV